MARRTHKQIKRDLENRNFYARRAFAALGSVSMAIGELEEAGLHLHAALLKEQREQIREATRLAASRAGWVAEDMLRIETA